MTYLPDVNVWIALAAERHTHHAVARHWFSDLQDETIAFCRLTQLGFLRLLTNKHVMQEEVMRPDEAWQAYRVLRSDRRIAYFAEPKDLPETWQAFTAGPLSSPNLWTDAYLCAFANAARCTLVTFDAKIPTRDDVICLLLGRGSQLGPTAE
jgi:toxin-antitoxin system PIN domain toxin